MFVYSDGVYELRGVDGRVRTHDEFLAPLEQADNRDLEAIVKHARAVRAGEPFDDDVSLVQLDFP